VASPAGESREHKDATTAIGEQRRNGAARVTGPRGADPRPAGGLHPTPAEARVALGLVFAAAAAGAVLRIRNRRDNT
jgi:hypothetical protein